MDVIDRKRKAKQIDRLKARFGDQFLTEMYRVHKQKGITFAKIAKQFGLTRERVRQIHLNLFGCGLRGIKERNDIEVGCMFDPRHKVVNYQKQHHTGAVSQKAFLDRLLKYKIQFDMDGKMHQTIFLVHTSSGIKRVIVHGASSPKSYSSNIAAYYQYGIRINSNYDIFAAYHIDDDSFSIIPKKALGIGDKIYISLKKHYKKRPGRRPVYRYDQYFENWNLLKTTASR